MASVSSLDMHKFPFTFYPADKPMCNYNQVNLLVKHGLHNVGIFRRLCSCYQNTAFGELSGERLAQLEAAQVTDPFEKFETLGLSKAWYPLSGGLKVGTDPRKIVSWKDLYDAKGVPLDDLGALVFEYAMTVWHMMNKYLMASLPPASSKGISFFWLMFSGKRVITIHLLGPEVECDLMPTFEILLALIPPKTDLAIHMCGPAVSPRLSGEHRGMYFKSEASDSSVLVTLFNSLYSPEHHSGAAFVKESGGLMPFGKGEPDLVVILNGNLLAHETWIPSIKLLVDAGQKTLLTEPMEQGADAIGRNLPALGGSLSLGATLNPFRQPIYHFKKDTNLPGFSNAFIFGFN